MWIAGVMQGLMWRTFNDDGTLTYTFIEVLQQTKPNYMLRFVGGVIFLSGLFIMLYNVWKTWQMRAEDKLDVAIQIGRASCRERVWLSEGSGTFAKHREVE